MKKIRKVIKKMELKKAIGSMLAVIIVVTGAIPYAGAETGESQLEFLDLYPASLAYEIGEGLAIVSKVVNTGTEDIENITISLSTFDNNGTIVAMNDYQFPGVLKPGVRHRMYNLVWYVDENATFGKYTVEAVVRWGSEAIQKTTFFYVPTEAPQTTPWLEITSLYTARLSYKPGEKVDCICRIKNAGTENVEEYYVSFCVFDQNGTLFDSMASSVNSLDAGKKVKHIMKGFDIPMDAEPGNYTTESIVWWNDTAVSKSAIFLVSNE